MLSRPPPAELYDGSSSPARLPLPCVPRECRHQADEATDDRTFAGTAPPATTAPPAAPTAAPATAPIAPAIHGIFGVLTLAGLGGRGLVARSRSR